MWVEADCNLPSGESLVRQIVYGKRFFREEFGIENRILWLPDVFGYSAALPQILKKSGIDWFVTSKISWSDTNQMPYDTFTWKGIDGTGIPTYFLTAQDKVKDRKPRNFTTYVAHMTPAMVAGTYERYQQKELTNETLITYGYGDGGGGTTTEDLETAKRLSKGIPGTPAVKLGFAGDFLSRLEKKIENNPRLPVWSGELYLERHRGTLTTMAKVKKDNRMCESLYLNTEFVCSLNKLFFGTAFPKSELRDGWEMILTNQFHDIISGSSIHDVYEQTDIDYGIIKKTASVHFEKALDTIAGNISDIHGDVIFNFNPAIGNGIVKKEGKSVYVSDIPAKGYACVSSVKSDNEINISDKKCESKNYRLSFDDDMLLTSVFDKKNNREVLKAGTLGNQLRVYEDFPEFHLDAWELEEHTLQKHMVIKNVESVEEVSDGVRAGLKITRKHMNSALVQTIWLYDDIERIDFETEVDWQERHQLLKAAFDVDINSSRATYEIQYGTIERPTHKNTSWDRAKFEVCGHRFADVSEGNFGVTLFNDCKYGYDIHDGLIMLSLLKSPVFPNPNADLGKMSFTYSLHTHSGGADVPSLYSMAYELNNPMILRKATGKNDLVPANYSFVSCKNKNILCEVIKEAENSEAYILRFFENDNTKTKADISFGFELKQAFRCDLEENIIRELDITNNKISLEFEAFEIHTIKIL
jgi:alpha-mannosidase